MARTRRRVSNGKRMRRDKAFHSERSYERNRAPSIMYGLIANPPRDQILLLLAEAIADAIWYELCCNVAAEHANNRSSKRYKPT